MHQFWKKIREKGRTQEQVPKRVISTLEPRYDGPLSGFHVECADTINIEKSNLKIEFIDLFENKKALCYFRQYLDFRDASIILTMFEELQVDMEELSNGKLNHFKNSNNFTNVALKEELNKLPEEIRNKIQCSVEGIINNSDSPSLRQTLLDALHYYWDEFIQSEWYCKYQVELLTSRTITLGDVLQHDSALSYFMQFLEQEGFHSVMEFWMAARTYHQYATNVKQDRSFDKEHVLNDAIIIYEKYLSLQATCPLGFSDNVRYAVEEAMCDENNGPDTDCFEPAVKVCLAFLRDQCLGQFFSSQHYVHLLSDTIRNSPVVANTSPPSSISEYSVECRQPLLSKLDPDSIWRRRKQSGLSFGKVDKLGRFQRDIEPDPSRKSESRVSKAVKKWIYKPENRVQEEMAWQVAEMVVKDITDLTMGGKTNDMDEYENYSFPSN